MTAQQLLREKKAKRRAARALDFAIPDPRKSSKPSSKTDDAEDDEHIK